MNKIIILLGILSLILLSGCSEVNSYDSCKRNQLGVIEDDRKNE